MTNIKHSVFLILTSLVLIFFGCGDSETPAEQNPPSYTKPAYTVAESNDTPVSLNFTDITESAGIDFIHETGAFGKKWMPETMGSGGGFLDYDSDGGFCSAGVFANKILRTSRGVFRGPIYCNPRDLLHLKQ